jgi:hypothetical protein
MEEFAGVTSPALAEPRQRFCVRSQELLGHELPSTTQTYTSVEAQKNFAVVSTRTSARVTQFAYANTCAALMFQGVQGISTTPRIDKVERSEKYRASVCGNY